jgi:hypothetical protein
MFSKSRAIAKGLKKSQSGRHVSFMRRNPMHSQIFSLALASTALIGATAPASAQSPYSYPGARARPRERATRQADISPAMRNADDDDLMHRRPVLPKPRLQRGAEFGAGAPPPALSMTLQAPPGRRSKFDGKSEAPAGQPGLLTLSNQARFRQSVTSSSWPASCSNHRPRRCACPNPTSRAYCISVRL